MKKLQGSNPNMYWRYKKRSAPTDEFADKNGPITIIKPATKQIPKQLKKTIPRAHRCSTCGYTAPTIQMLEIHADMVH